MIKCKEDVIKSMESIQERLGKAVYEYFLQRTSSNESFKLLIDSYTYEYCARQANLVDKEIEHLLLGEGFYNCFSPFSSLAIAALEVKIAYDVETDSDLINSYNRRLIGRIKYCSDENSVQLLYRSCDQEAIWKRVQLLFKKENRNLIIPPEKTGSGRYVQYPLSQRIISGKKIIEYADRFINLRLEPGSGITYLFFEKLVFKWDDFYNYDENQRKNLKRMVFSFYCIWDGRSYKEIYNHTRILTEQREQNAKDEFLIKLQPEIQLFINRELINLEEKRIDDKYLWRFDVSTSLSRQGKIFIQDNDYKDWLPKYKNTIDEDDEILLITEQTYFPKYIDEFIKNDQIEVFSIGKYKLLLLTDFSREDFEKLRIPVKPIPCFSLVGGLKIKRNTYYDFALPSIKINDTVENRTFYKSVYIDTKEYPIKDGIATITDELKSGRHYVKLLDSWDSSEVYFNVEKASNTEISDNHGWFLNYSQKTVIPFCEDYEKTIDGLKCVAKMNWIERKNENIIDKSLRMFQQQNENLLNRYCKVGNKTLNRRQNYGI